MKSATVDGNEVGAKCGCVEMGGGWGRGLQHEFITVRVEIESVGKSSRVLNSARMSTVVRASVYKHTFYVDTYVCSAGICFC